MTAQSAYCAVPGRAVPGANARLGTCGNAAVYGVQPSLFNDLVMDPLIAKLQISDRRSIGRSEEVVGDVLADPDQFRLVFDAMLVPDPAVRMRAADAVEKITRRRPDLLRGLEGRVLTEVAAIGQQEVRWHVAPLPRACP
jgi:hypothetical protein